MSIKLSKLFLLVTAVILFTGTSSTFAGVCGDANNDGTGPDLSDLTYLVSYLFMGGPPPPQMYSANVNGDSEGNVDLSDLVYLVNYLFLGGSALSCPISTPHTTTIIPPEGLDIIQGYDTAGVITLSQSSYYAQQLAVGDIIIGQDDVNAPHGFLRRVTSMATQGVSIVMETDPATMMEAFEEMDIDETVSLNPAGVKSLKLFNGTTFQPNKDGKTFEVSLNCVLYDLDGDPGTTDDQIRLDGTYAFTAELFAKIKINLFSLKEFEVGLQTNEQVSLDLIASVQWEFNEAVEVDLAEFYLGAIPIGGAVWLVPTLTVEAHIHGDLTVTLETGITYTQELRTGFGWADDAFYTISESTKNFSYAPPQFRAEFNVEPGVSLNASCLLYGVAGPYVGAKAGFQFMAALSADPCEVELLFNLDAILYAVAGIECDLLNLDYNHQWQLYTYLIGEWTYSLGGSSTIAIDVEPDAINAPWSLSGPCSYSVGGTGDETLVDLSPGEYTVTWGPEGGWITPSNSTQTVQADETLTFNGTYTQQGGPDSTGTVTDIDGNVYQTVKIGDQWWMAENLKVTRYRNGDSIPNVTNGSTWSGLSTGAYCEYDNNPANVSTYGRLYNWYAVDDSRNIAPEGWHVPTDDEWKQLEMYLGMSQGDVDGTGWRGTDEGGRLKDTTHWVAPNAGATNESGFTALPAGYRNDDFLGSYMHIATYATFWSSTYSTTSRSWHRDLHSNYSNIQRIEDDQNDGYSIRCVRDDLSVPEVSTSGVTGITQTTALCGGGISSDGGSEVTARGVCWSTDPIPTIADNQTVDGAGTGSYVSSVSGLTPNTTYYIRAYATNGIGTGYGTIHSFTTLSMESGTVTDIDGNVYQTIKIGDQWWMMENLKVTHYRNGEPIPHVTNGSTWSGLSTGAYCEYDNNPANVSTYGRLYNWYAVDDSRNIAPEGWHVPTDDEWKQLEMYLGMSQQEADGVYWRGSDEGGKLKDTGTTHWSSPNTGATNESGFTALPGGYRRISSGEFSSKGLNAYFWSLTQGSSNLAWDRRLYYDHSLVYRSSDYKRYGFSVRCVRD